MSLLDALRTHSAIVVDSGDFKVFQPYSPEDATTNPSLLLKVAGRPEYQELVKEALGYARDSAKSEEERVQTFMEKLAVNFGCQILTAVKGRVSTETDARLSFDTGAIVEQAQRLIVMYRLAGIDKSRVLIKVASTWEGIRAAADLERQGIHCNLTLMFSFAQAIACAEAGVTLVSPFVGRIYDWYKKERGVDDIPLSEDPGVQSVRRIYTYYKQHGYQTQVMGASFRKKEQILELAGCDLLTCSPQLLGELAAIEGQVERRLSPEKAKSDEPMPKLSLDEKSFRWLHNQDAMAVEKLSEGIRLFDADSNKLAEQAKAMLAQAGL